MEVFVAGPGTFSVDVVGVSRRQDELAEIVERHGRSGRTVTTVALLVLEDSNRTTPMPCASKSMAR
jgi:hypothetical protein